MSDLTTLVEILHNLADKVPDRSEHDRLNIHAQIDSLVEKPPVEAPVEAAPASTLDPVATLLQESFNG